MSIKTNALRRGRSAPVRADVTGTPFCTDEMANLRNGPKPYVYGRIRGMKKTLHIDEGLLKQAKSASGAKTDTETVRLGLEALVRRAAYERLRALRGSEPHAREIPRRRERSSAARHSAA